LLSLCYFFLRKTYVKASGAPHQTSPIIQSSITDHGRPNNIIPFHFRGTLTWTFEATSPVARIESIVFSMPFLPKQDVVVVVVPRDKA
jgi:hypothetical protein